MSQARSADRNFRIKPRISIESHYKARHLNWKLGSSRFLLTFIKKYVIILKKDFFLAATFQPYFKLSVPRKNIFDCAIIPIEKDLATTYYSS